MNASPIATHPLKSAGLCTAAMLFAATPLHAGQMRLSAGVDITSGAYGGASEIDIIYSSVAARYAGDDWSVRLNVPVVNVTGAGLLTDSSVAVLQVAPPDFTERIDDFVSLTGLVSGPGEVSSTGLGDITISALKSFPLKRRRLYADVSGTLKLPTADRRKLLGTGEVEGAAQLDIVYHMDAFSVIAGGGRRFTARSRVFPLDDAWLATAGAFMSAGPDITVGVLYDWREAIFLGAPAASELTSYVSVPIGARWSAVAYGVAGLSEGSPDYGFGLRFSFDFEPRFFSRR